MWERGMRNCFHAPYAPAPPHSRTHPFFNEKIDTTMPTTLRTETFSYLPQMTPEQVVSQVKYILENGWIPGIEHTEKPEPRNSYWNFYELPFFDAKTPEEVMTALEACRAQNPGSYIKITGYDNIRQAQVLSFVVDRPD